MSEIDLHALHLKYDKVREFCEGLAAVSKDGKHFHVCTDGTPAYKERYDCVGDFYDGTAMAIKNDDVFRIRHNGDRVSK